MVSSVEESAIEESLLEYSLLKEAPSLGRHNDKNLLQNCTYISWSGSTIGYICTVSIKSVLSHINRDNLAFRIS